MVVVVDLLTPMVRAAVFFFFLKKQPHEPRPHKQGRVRNHCFTLVWIKVVVGTAVLHRFSMKVVVEVSVLHLFV